MLTLGPGSVNKNWLVKVFVLKETGMYDVPNGNKEVICTMLYFNYSYLGFGLDKLSFSNKKKPKPLGYYVTLVFNKNFVFQM